MVDVEIRDDAEREVRLAILAESGHGGETASLKGTEGSGGADGSATGNVILGTY